MDLDGDGQTDILSGSYSPGDVYLFAGKPDGSFAAGLKLALGDGRPLEAGRRTIPFACDWDSDGLADLLVGTMEGQVLLFRNQGAPGKLALAPATPLLAAGQPVKVSAYAAPSVADWDGDGLPDLVVNSILGKVHWHRNIGTRRAPKLAAAQPIEVEWEGAQPRLAWGWMRPEGKALLTQWRTTPVAVDWNRDGLTDLVMLDQEGYLAFFERAERDGGRVLLHPKRIFRNENGEALQFNGRRAGHSGRRKICIVDWDGDGRLDILINSRNAEFWRQVGDRDGQFFFRNMGNLNMRSIEGHDVSPTVVDFDGDGIPDFVGGAEDGYLYHLSNPRSAAK